MPLLNNEILAEKIKKSAIRVNGHWIVDKYKNGYGKIYANGKNWLFHRLSYEVFVGEIPEGFQVDHLCKITNCVNPDHLEAVTPRENSVRSNSVSGINSRKTHCKFGHPLSGNNLYMYGGRTARQCRRCHADREAKRRNKLATPIA